MNAGMHAEEVQLKKNLLPPPIYSTTGRRQQPVTGQSHAKPAAVQQDSRSKREIASRVSSKPGDSLPAKLPPPIPSEEHSDCIRTASFYDRYGFRVSEEEKVVEDLQRYAIRNASHTAKWEKVALRWDTTSHATKKRCCRAGIPQPMRWRLWQRLMGSLNLRNDAPLQSQYSILRATPLNVATIDTIERDLPRTFPTNRYFSGDSSSLGQSSLRGVLYAYANYNPCVGYCQGMGFLAATLLIQIEDEENAFWALCALMGNPRYNLQHLYEPGFPQLHCCFYVLENLLKKRDQQLYSRMQKFHIETSFYATHWFLTLFSYHLNFTFLSRIWDMFLCEGWKPIYRIALAFLKLDRSRLLAQQTDVDFLMALKDVLEDKKPERVLRVAKGIKFTTAYVQTLTKRYYASQPRGATAS